MEEKNKKNTGMNLVEVVVTISILAMLMGVVSLFVIRVFSANYYSIEQGLNTSSLQSTIRSFTTNLREAKQGDDGAYMIVSGNDFEITFFANVDDDSKTERLHYYLQDEQLKLGITEPSDDNPPIYPSGDQEVRILGAGIINNVSQKLFYYYNRDYPNVATGNPLAVPIIPNQISLVKLDVFANIDPMQLPDSMRMETFIRPRNVNR